MNLADALDELRVGILRDFSTLKSGTPPDDHYWTDRRLVTYIDDAHKRFARLSLCIHDDTTPSVTRVVLSKGKDVYQLHQSVLMVLSARHQDDQQDLVRITHQRVANTQNTYTEDFEFAIVTTPGKPVRFTTDEGMDPSRSHAVRMRFVGVPDDTQQGKTVYLRTIRKPIAPITLDNMDVEFEIPDDYHLDMLEWGAFRALRNWDIDSEDRAKAVQHKERFELAIKECKRDIERKMWAPYTWQFGQASWSYVKN